jgi:orotidine 5'-phosphate decarboxylase subfamily 1
VREQYTGGIYRVAEWADLVTVHSIPGPGILKGLGDAFRLLGRPRGILLLAEMSSEGSLATGVYTEKSIEMAKKYHDIIAGFICQKRYETGSHTDADEFLYMTPGVSLEREGDSLGQQYNDPETVVIDRRSDIIIVGRGILKHSNPLEATRNYREIAWNAYERRDAVP